MLVKDTRKVLPKAPVSDHINKQGMYTNFIKNGSTDDAKVAFSREPWYLTVARMEKEKQDKKEDKDVN